MHVLHVPLVSLIPAPPALPVSLMPAPPALPAPPVSLMLVDMERSYVTAGFFRHTMYNRYNRITQQAAMQQAGMQAHQQLQQQMQGAKGAPSPQMNKSKSFFPSFEGGDKGAQGSPPGGAPKSGGLDQDGNSDDDEAGRTATGKEGGEGRGVCRGGGGR